MDQIRHYVAWSEQDSSNGRPFLVLAKGNFPPTDSVLEVETTFHDAGTGRRLNPWIPLVRCDFRFALGAERQTLPCVQLLRTTGGLEAGDSFIVRARVTAKAPRGKRETVGQVESKPYVLQAAPD